MQRLQRAGARPFAWARRTAASNHARGASTDDAVVASTQVMYAIGHRALEGLLQANGANASP